MSFADKGVLGNIERAEVKSMSPVLQRAARAVSKVRSGGHHGFDDEIARAVIESLMEPSEEMLAAGSANPGWPGLFIDWRWKQMIGVILA